MTMQPGTSYDDLPYPSHAFVSTSPDRLATVAAILGLEPPDLATARVLELGGSSGGNLLPHAASFPGGTFLGLDLSARQVQIGRQAIAEVGLDNARLEVADLRTWRPEPGAWDYVLCHGVYSWVSDDVRKAILAICREALSPQGVACISFNVDPGWKLQGVVTDAMNYLGRPGDDAHRRAAHARHVLEFLARSMARSETAYARTLARVFTATRHTTDSYLAHEYLDGHHVPLSLTDFVRQVHEGGLQYLGDASLALMVPGLLGEATHKQVASLARDVVTAEQYMDYLWARTFRTALVVRSDTQVERMLSQFDARRFFVSTKVSPTETDTPGTFELRAPNNEVAFETAHPGLVAFVNEANARWPVATAFGELEALSAAELGPMPEPFRQAWVAQLAQWTLYAHAMGLAELHRHPYANATQVEDRPRAWSWALFEASRQRLVTNLRHEAIPLDTDELFVLSRCNGERTREDLLAEMVDVVQRRNALADAADPVPDRADLDKILDTLAANAMLVKEATPFALPTREPPGERPAGLAGPTLHPVPSEAPTSTAPSALSMDAALALVRVLGLPVPDGDVRDLDEGFGPCTLATAWRGPTRTADRAGWFAELGRHLEPGGLAVVHAHCLPGWHMLGAVRDLLHFHRERHGGTLEEAVVRMRELVETMPDLEDLPWRRWFLAVADRSDDPVLRDALTAETLNPAPLHVLVEEAAQAGLHYVCDAHLPTTSRASLPPEVRAFVLDDLATWGDRVRAEQIGDYVRNQHGRLLILRRGEVPDVLSFDVDEVRSLRFAAGDEDQGRWSLQPAYKAPLAVLSEPDSPRGAFAVGSLLRGLDAPVDFDTLASMVAKRVTLDADELALAVLAAAEVGCTQLRRP